MDIYTHRQRYICIYICGCVWGEGYINEFMYIYVCVCKTPKIHYCILILFCWGGPSWALVIQVNQSKVYKIFGPISFLFKKLTMFESEGFFYKEKWGRGP